ncbi:MAG: DUF1905 domain-containing protein [Actinomycetota bacterium]
MTDYVFSADVWLHQGTGPWHFVTLPFDMSDEIDERTTAVQHGFGSVKVEATIGSFVWSTSLFPSDSAKSYILPLKKAARIAEGFGGGDTVTVSLRLVDL